ncbi:MULTISPECIES: molybdenum cofactor guanylyltransferase [Bacillus]|uniref:molybdenum cofactor guanylyltransferase n=1 Tax=Bacillus TaxID=1386 RepID=UPI0012FE9544|nr:MULTISPECIES: molybdenum cofactor guanylyltransferase [Bacillus]
MNEVTGILLSGGKSSRFGSPKAFAKFNEKEMYEYSLDILEEMTNEVVISSSPILTPTFQAKGFKNIVEDVAPFLGKGPLAGIYSCMKRAPSQWYVVLPCDMPLLSKKMMNIMLDKRTKDVDAILPDAFGRVQPLVGIYYSSVMAILEKKLREDKLKMMEFIQDLNVTYLNENQLHIQDDIFQNVNRETDLINMKGL